MCCSMIKDRNPRFVLTFEIVHDSTHERVIDCSWLAMGKSISALLHLR
jgi:hypothetical protein